MTQEALDGEVCRMRGSSTISGMTRVCMSAATMPPAASAATTKALRPWVAGDTGTPRDEPAPKVARPMQNTHRLHDAKRLHDRRTGRVGQVGGVLGCDRRPGKARHAPQRGGTRQRADHGRGG